MYFHFIIYVYHCNYQFLDNVMIIKEFHFGLENLLKPFDSTRLLIHLLSNILTLNGHDICALNYISTFIFCYFVFDMIFSGTDVFAIF